MDGKGQRTGGGVSGIHVLFRWNRSRFGFVAFSEYDRYRMTSVSSTAGSPLVVILLGMTGKLYYKICRCQILNSWTSFGWYISFSSRFWHYLITFDLKFSSRWNIMEQLRYLFLDWFENGVANVLEAVIRFEKLSETFFQIKLDASPKVFGKRCKNKLDACFQMFLMLDSKEKV